MICYTLAFFGITGGAGFQTSIRILRELVGAGWWWISLVNREARKKHPESKKSLSAELKCGFHCDGLDHDMCPHTGGGQNPAPVGTFCPPISEPGELPEGGGGEWCAQDAGNFARVARWRASPSFSRCPNCRKQLRRQKEGTVSELQVMLSQHVPNSSKGPMVSRIQLFSRYRHWDS